MNTTAIVLAVWGATVVPLQDPQAAAPPPTVEHQSVAYSTAICIYRLRMTAVERNIKSGYAAGTVRGRIYAEDWATTLKAMKAEVARIKRDARKGNISIRPCSAEPVASLAKCGSLVYPEVSCTPEQESEWGEDIGAILEPDEDTKGE